ncbi:indole-3-glycerol phosphate synthase TrpC [Paenibacillus macerans]|uniref:Indole-3-glycerol phosphate synthase n=1 Tax=Paenibacillus macerans TaxID=44252 RepID=A0A090ZGC4_PAEMA|nr:indole-3-glycerol phosphate synthase TrpC [Paenibacillus macerans]KFN09453.1 indole-3-glycerol phosphate synthase family protein [Paenibacillus macerans]MBS5909433.1 indole-3-glycerol phosphate synthase TrpC [Paenibacillus macerans]MCY7561796.1 indole-3-glycerol phosphate synthase TrpC [Paenibacillus macerans]MEC0141656.1 indole-3-glycerol phosphate synthase TrpC [Paenibacillus macerans]MEC0150426.1 indole-3-glycerol phosphate synthase TrpC [Paenibacillus macerans]
MYLERIVETKKSEVEHLAAVFSLADAERRIAELAPARGFHRALASGRKREMGLIAEVKKASPSKGLIRPDFHPVELAKSYEAAGTDCISVLTDETYFQGSGAYLSAIREAVKVPLLRKDFVIDERQIYEARLLGADAVLLIAAILSDAQLRDYLKTVAALGLDALVEVHDREEMERVLALGTAGLIGINNRNLRTFEVSLETTAALAELVPPEVTLISESGIRTREDIAYLAANGAKGVLIGETFMRQADVGQAVHELMGLLPQAAAPGGTAERRAAHE